MEQIFSDASPGNKMFEAVENDVTVTLTVEFKAHEALASHSFQC